MTTPHSRNRMTAWLGLVAMWFIVFAPVVSQLLVSQRANEPIAALCSALQPRDLSAAISHSGYTNPAPVHLSHDDAFGACGYCHLLGHHVAMPTLEATTPLAGFAIAGTAPPALSTRFTPLGAFPSGRPRDPPAVS